MREMHTLRGFSVEVDHKMFLLLLRQRLGLDEEKFETWRSSANAQLLATAAAQSTRYSRQVRENYPYKKRPLMYVNTQLQTILDQCTDPTVRSLVDDLILDVQVADERGRPYKLRLGNLIANCALL